MVQVTYPGVYIVEKSSGVRTITGVATSVAAFVGYTRKGVPDKAVTITSYADFERGYGGLDRDSPLSYAVRQFFSNGGTQAIIVRVAINFETATWTIDNGAGNDIVRIRASSPGRWGNDLRIAVQHTGTRNPDSDFNLIVLRLQPDGVSFAPVETHRNLSMNDRSDSYFASVVNNSSALITTELVGPPAFAKAGYAISKEITTIPILSTPNNTIGLTLGGTDSFVLTIPDAPWATIANLVTKVTAAIATAGLAAEIEAAETNPDGTAGTGALKITAKTAGRYSSVSVARGSATGLAAKLGLGLLNCGREVTGAAEHRPVVIGNTAPTIVGEDGDRGGPINLEGSPSAKTGMYALLDVDLFNILCIPETFDMSGGQEAALVNAAIAFCHEERAFYIADAPSTRTLSNIATWAGGFSQLQAMNAATYFPPLRLPDPLDGNRPRPFAPSGTLAGLYARTDATRGVWKAPAGIDASLNGVLGLTIPLNDRENGLINPLGINALREFPAAGRVAWGARTLRGNDALGDEYKYIPIRRLALFLEESLYRGTQWVVFEPNDEPLWAQIRLNLGAFMNGLFRQGAFQGKTPQEAYFVKCDKETTTQADRNLGIVNILVGFAPLKPAEFVVLTIQQIAGDL